MTDTFKPYEPPDEPGYDYDEYYEEPRRGNNVLWGRVALLGLGLLIAFFLGRATAGGGGEDLEKARADLEQVEQEKADLQERLAAAEADADTLETPSTEPSVPADDSTPAESDAELETYTVEPGDTLRGIAQTFCGDPQLDDLIAAENGIDDATQLSVGAELVLPAECTA